MVNKNEKMISSKYLIGIIIIIGIFLLIPLAMNFKDKDYSDEDKTPSISVEPENVEMTLTAVKTQMNDLYGGENKVVEVNETDDKYIVTVTNSINNRVLNKYEMDKETGVIEEISLGYTTEASSNYDK